MKTHLSPCSEWMDGGTLGDIWRPLEGHFIFPLNRWKSPPQGIQRLDNHNDRRSSSWHSPIPQFHNERMCQGDGMLHAKAQSHASDSYAKCDGEGVGEKAWALREAAVCVCRNTGDNCLRNNHTTDWNTQTSSDPWNKSLCENLSHADRSV